MSTLSVEREHVIVAHSHCWDGAISAAIAHKSIRKRFKYKTAPHIHFTNYGKPALDLEIFKDRYVYILDFSFDRATLESIAAVAYEIIVLDHHATAQRNLEGLSYAKFDQNKSGVRLTYEYFEDLWDCHHYLKDIVEYFDNIDLWNFVIKEDMSWSVGDKVEASPATRCNLPYFYFGLFLIPISLDNALWFLDGATLWRQCLNNGTAVKEMVDRIVSASVTKARYIDFGDKHNGEGRVLMVQATPFDSSLINNVVAAHLALLSESGIGGTYNMSPERVTMSIRSNTHNTLDISEIYNGGGHSSASGMRCEFDRFCDLLKESTKYEGV